MKAFKDEKGDVYLFRPMENMNRFLKSCKRIALPGFYPEELLEVVK